MMKKLFDKNIFWIIWLGSLCIISCFFSFFALRDIYTYLSLDSRTQTQKISWFQEESWLGRWTLIGDYIYQVNGIEYHQKCPKKSEQYLNEKRAEKAIEEKKGKQEIIWYSQNSPHISALEKIFPVNLTVRASISIFIFLYFLGMKLFVKYE